RQQQPHKNSKWRHHVMRTAGSHLGLGGADYALLMGRETLFLDREPPQRESLLTSQGHSLYGRDPALSTVLPTTRSARIARTGGPFVTQVSSQFSFVFDSL
nr:RNA-binding KH domain-containing protein PEPPER-like [Tanacetum cinerariifolium]